MEGQDWLKFPACAPLLAPLRPRLPGSWQLPQQWGILVSAASLFPCSQDANVFSLSPSQSQQVSLPALNSLPTLSCLSKLFLASQLTLWSSCLLPIFILSLPFQLPLLRPSTTYKLQVNCLSYTNKRQIQKNPSAFPHFPYFSSFLSLPLPLLILPFCPFLSFTPWLGLNLGSHVCLEKPSYLKKQKNKNQNNDNDKTKQKTNKKHGLVWSCSVNVYYNFWCDGVSVFPLVLLLLI